MTEMASENSFEIPLDVHCTANTNLCCVLQVVQDSVSHIRAVLIDLLAPPSCQGGLNQARHAAPASTRISVPPVLHARHRDATAGDSRDGGTRGQGRDAAARRRRPPG